MSEKIDNRLARREPHEHPAGEEYSDAELRNHMVRYHGWTLGMMQQRGWIEDGSYVRASHANEHKTGHLDPPNQRQPKEW